MLLKPLLGQTKSGWPQYQLLSARSDSISRKNPNPVAVQDFLRYGEHIQPSWRGIALQSLPHPWNQAAIFLKKYITCEGRYQIVYHSKLPLLSHLHHRALLNIPFYLFNDLHHMVGFVRNAKHPISSLTHHGLIKLIILRTLSQQNQTWEQFTGQVQEPDLLLVFQ